MMRLLDRLYDRSHITFAIGWIVAYVMLVSWADGVSLALGTAKLVTVPLTAAMVGILLLWGSRPEHAERYGLGSPHASSNSMLWYAPLMLLVLAKLLFVADFSGTLLERILFAISMLCVGFLEEFIFRGLLYRAMDESGHVSAVVVSSLTFGMGHIVNLFNASGQDLVETIAQIVFAVAVGFALVMVLERCGSLWPCIVFHGIYNGSSALAGEQPPVALLLSGHAADVVFIVIGVALCAGYIAFLTRAR